MASTPACHQMVFITCFVLTSIQYEWKSIFHLDRIVSLLWQHRRSSPELRRSSSAGPPLPPRSCILYLITCVSGPRRQVYEALGNYSWEGELGGIHWWYLSHWALVVLTDTIWWRCSDPNGGCCRCCSAFSSGSLPRGKSPRSNLCSRVRAAIKAIVGFPGNRTELHYIASITEVNISGHFHAC